MIITESNRGKLSREQCGLILSNGLESGITVYFADKNKAGTRFVIGLQGFSIPRDYVRDAHVVAIREIAHSTPLSVGYGLWEHEGLVYFDAITVTDNYSDAVNIAKERNQIAIYDSLRNETIYI